MNKKLQIIQDGIKEIARINKAIQKEITDLPDNPNIKRVSTNCFVMSSKNLGDNWSAFYHDFHAQYNKIAEVINNSGAENIVSNIHNIIESEAVYYNHKYWRLNPQVVNNLKKIMGITGVTEANTEEPTNSVFLHPLGLDIKK